MFLKIILLVTIIFFITNKIEPETMKCKDVIIKDSPIASVYDVVYNLETGKYENKIFDKESKEYKKLLKDFLKNLKKYCYVN